MTSALLLLLAAAPCEVWGDDVSTRAAVMLAVDGGAPVKASLRGLAVRATLEGTTARLTGWGHATAEVTVPGLALEDARLLIDATAVQWPDAGVP